MMLYDIGAQTERVGRLRRRDARVPQGEQLVELLLLPV